MSEKLASEAEKKNDNFADDDPLAELARIVAGEPDPVLETNDVSDAAISSDVPEQSSDATGYGADAPSVDIEQSLEDALVADLEAQAEPAPAVHVEADTLPEPAQEITEAVDNISMGVEPAPVEFETEPVAVEQQQPVFVAPAEEAVPTVEEYHEPAAMEPIEPEVKVSGDEAFEDDLISALQGELDGSTAPESAEVYAEMPAEEVEPAVIYAAEASEPAAQPASDLDVFEKSLAAELDAELSPETAQHAPAIDASQKTSAPDNSLAQNVALAAGGSAAVAATAAVANEASDIEQDLGAAFDQEFEQMLASEPQAEVRQIDPVEIAPIQEPVVQEAEQVSVEELDFGSAFAEELGVENVEEFEGWSESDSQAASDEFSHAVQPDQYDEFVSDPGHAELMSGEEAGIHEGLVPANQGKSGSLKYAVAALLLALFAGSIVAGYGFLGGDGGATDGDAPAVIKAETDPVKVKPKDPGGKVIANQDKASYDRVAGTDTEEVSQDSLISTTEEPAKIETNDVLAETNLTTKTDERLTVDTQTQDTSTSNGSSESTDVKPRVVQTVTVKPDGTILQTPVAAPKVAEAVTQTAEQIATNTSERLSTAQQDAGNLLLATVEPVIAETVTIPQSIDGARSTGGTAVPQASPLPKPAVKPKPQPVRTAAVTPKKPANPAPVRRSEWVVQVSSQRTPEAAQSSFRNLRNRFSVLQGRPMSVSRANVNGATFYRVRVQTTSRNDANQLCQRLQSAGGSCFVTR